MAHMTPEAHNILVRARHPDEDVLDDIEAALWKDPDLRSLDWTSLAITVQDGQVLLRGHVAQLSHPGKIESIAARVPGVVVVHNHLVADRTLITQVAQALASDRHTRAYPIRVGAFHGWIHLSGEAPEEVARAAEEAAAWVPDVRGVLEAPHLMGYRRRHEKRRPIQPAPGAPVYTADGLAGKVSEVVISPRNKLVTHVVTLARFEVKGEQVQADYVVPVEAIDLVSTSGVFLEETLETLAGLPVLSASHFPPAPADWRPPFPYEPGTVRWPPDARGHRPGPGASSQDVES
jgi:osmotically-inducible protein OsmY